MKAKNRFSTAYVRQTGRTYILDNKITIDGQGYVDPRDARAMCKELNRRNRLGLDLKTGGNKMTNIPAAACPRCGGWTSFGGMSQFANSKVPAMGRTGCTCNKTIS